MANGEDQWRALAELTRMSKPAQRRVLRMHKETGFDEDGESEAVLLRRRLDDELQIIMLRELGALADPDTVNDTYSDIPAFGTLLRDSPAFVQYLNYYCYFGVRFAAGRIANPCMPTAPNSEDCNEQISGLPAPPLCAGVWQGRREFARFLAHTTSTDLVDEKIMTALRFLDDFVAYSDDTRKDSDGPERAPETPNRPPGSRDERHDFELWLRGLYSGGPDDRERTDERFRSLSAGLLNWAENRCDFYLSLEKSSPKKQWLAKWQEAEWNEGRFNVNNPIVARCALVDFYWLSRILRAEVTPRGLISYSCQSWLWLLAMRAKPLANTAQELENLRGPRARTFETADMHNVLQQAAADEPIRDETVAALMMALYLHPQPPEMIDPLQWKRILRLMADSVQGDEELEAEVIECLRGVPYQSFSLKRNEDGSLPKGEILRIEEVLRTVFAYACDLIQNAIQVAENCEQRKRNPADDLERPATTKFWRSVYDDELREISDQRREWRTEAVWSTGAGRDAKCDDSDKTLGWSRRIWTGEDVANLVGIAFSGGGIRSATFNLGVLQRLQELNLLRDVDYLSTVSGGGYIGAWLIGNVRRTRYWLSRTTNWDRSVEHLRRYSSYLAPRNGLLSADTWSIWATWTRNASLIQLTGFSWLAFLIVVILGLRALFVGIGTAGGGATGQAVLSVLLGAIAVIVSFYLWQLSKPYMSPREGSLERFRIWALRRGNHFAKAAALIAWMASFVAAALLWAEVKDCQPDYQAYSKILLKQWRNWYIVLWVLVPALCGLAFSGFIPKRRSGILTRSWPLVITLGTAAACYLAVCAVLLLFGAIAPAPGEYLPMADWIAFVVGPAATLAAMAIGIGFYIGLLGRDSADWSREWWTRYGAWIAMYAAAALALAAGAVFSPVAIFKLFSLSGPWISTLKVGTIAGWIGSVVSGLLAGKSSRTGKETQSSANLELVARAGGLVFAVGAVMIVATVVYAALGKIVLDTFIADHYWQDFNEFLERWQFWVTLPALLCLSLLFSDRFDLNIFGLNQFYRNRLVRCYLGATRWQPGKRHPHRFTQFDPADDIDLACLTVKNSLFCGESFRGPLPIINCTLNLGGSSDLSVHTRQSASFNVTPLYCGSDRLKVGYAPTPQYSGKVTLGQAISISGAAASPNMGYNTSPLVSLLLTMFNVRLGWWFPNPGSPACQETGSLSAAYLVRELFGTADDRRPFVNVSDGGHFENLGIYELVRRGTRVIIAGDAECDEDMTFESLGRAVRICETDFGARIDLDVESLRKHENGMSRNHCAVGKIHYCNGSIGYLIYLKSSLTGDEDVGISQYRASHQSFPHETTADQFFSEDQFEAYRRLGYHITKRAFSAAENEPPEFYAIASKLFDVWATAPFGNQAFMDCVKMFDTIWDRFRTDQNLANLFGELTGVPVTTASVLTAAEVAAVMELLQLMENVFLTLRLDDFWTHPDNRGWAMLFTKWAQSVKFREVWDLTRQTYGIRFEYFCNRYLGLNQDRPVVRV